MATRGRPAGFKMPDSHRTKIANSKVLKRLIDFAEGKPEVEMSPHQVTAAVALLRKCLPDLSNVEITGKDGEALKVVIASSDAAL